MSTPSDGSYAFADLVAGTLNLRVSRSGYDSSSRKITLRADMREDFSLRRASSPAPSPAPPAPTPNPPPDKDDGDSCSPSTIPANATCINDGDPPVTAICKDGAYSCSRNRSGTCSWHGGVKCWVCPGLLCKGLTDASQSLNYSLVPALGAAQ